MISNDKTCENWRHWEGGDVIDVGDCSEEAEAEKARKDGHS